MRLFFRSRFHAASLASTLILPEIGLDCGRPALTPIERVTERVMRHGNPEQRSVPTPLLTLEEFFEGNDDVGSIGCNLISEPKPSEFYALLKEIRDKSSVADIRVQITCVDTPGVEWPFSDTVWIMTNVSAGTVAGWFPESLAPSDVRMGWSDRQVYEHVAAAEGYHPVAAWWD
jgi:hypothetical protein